MGKLYSTKETAELLGISAATLNTWRSTHRYPLPFVKLGHIVKYRAEDLQVFIESRIRGEVQK